MGPVPINGRGFQPGTPTRPRRAWTPSMPSSTWAGTRPPGTQARPGALPGVHRPGRPGRRTAGPGPALQAPLRHDRRPSPMSPPWPGPIRKGSMSARHQGW